jgi:hypothetical protein
MQQPDFKQSSVDTFNSNMRIEFKPLPFAGEPLGMVRKAFSIDLLVPRLSNKRHRDRTCKIIMYFIHLNFMFTSYLFSAYHGTFTSDRGLLCYIESEAICVF